VKSLSERGFMAYLLQCQVDGRGPAVLELCEGNIGGRQDGMP
jgi:hypothetical protein